MNTLITSMIIALTVTNLACSSHTTNSTNNPKPSLWKRLFKCPLSNTANKRTTNSPVSSSSISSTGSNREGFTQMTPYLVKAATNNNKKPIKKTPLPAQERLPEWHGRIKDKRTNKP